MATKLSTGELILLILPALGPLTLTTALSLLRLLSKGEELTQDQPSPEVREVEQALEHPEVTEPLETTHLGEGDQPEYDHQNAEVFRHPASEENLQENGHPAPIPKP